MILFKKSKSEWKTSNIGVIMSPLPLHNKVGDILLNKLMTILIKSDIQKIYIISGNVPKNIFPYTDKIKVIDNISYNTLKKHIILKSFIYLLMQIKFSISILKHRKKLDLIIFWISSSLLLPMITAKILKKKTLVMATGYTSVIYEHMKVLESLNYYLTDLIGVESKCVIKHMNLQVYKSKVVVIHLYVDDNYVIRTKIKDRNNIVGYISRLSEEKGIIEFLDAAKQLIEKKHNIIFFIGGDGPLKQVVEHRVKKMERIDFVNWIPSENFIDTLNKLKLLVLPSFTEGLPNIVLEAMACGTPVLATPVGGIPDVIIDKQTGFIIIRNSPECIAENIVQALDNQNLNQISIDSRNLIVQKYTLDKAINNFNNFLRKLNKNK
ncbi:MAG: glycosyltransferase family 4 protein, partial [Candidatus Methanoperedens sp.]|nr:glycosyltransferase family 4 protein [Candidatus Methanoperedens sp.]